MNQELQDYIKKSKEAGFSDEQIKQELLKVGWKEKDINQEFGGAFVPTPTPTTSNLASENHGIVYYYLAVLRKYATFKGRARRKEYWSFFLVNFIIGILFGIVSVLIHDKGLFGSLYALAMMIPGIAVMVRRLHDTDRSGSWWFIWLIPFVGFIILLVFMFQDSKSGINKYGQNPKEVAEQDGVHKSILVPIIITALIFIVGGVLGYVYLIKPSAPKNTVSDQGSQNVIPEVNEVLAVNNCGSAQFVKSTSAGTGGGTGVSVNYAISFPVPKTINDKEALKCFDNALLNCQKAKLSIIDEDGNNYSCEIKGEEGQNCLFAYSLVSTDHKTENKVCKIPSQIMALLKTQINKNPNSEGTGVISLIMLINASKPGSGWTSTTDTPNIICVDGK